MCVVFTKYYRVIKSRSMRWIRQVARIGEKKSAYKILVGKPDGRSLLGRPRHRWEDNIRSGLREIRWKMWNGCNWLKTEIRGGLL